jgi:phospholipid/cholesterol/gamma-HCH transport system substrate-binding protein
MDKLGDLADRLTEIASNISEVTNRVKRGEGTVGKLLNDNETIDRINQTLSGVNKFITKADKMQIFVEARSAALTGIGGSRSAFNLILQPSYDKYYLFGAHVRPQGVTTVTRTTTIANPDSPGATPVTVQTKEKLKRPTVCAIL